MQDGNLQLSDLRLYPGHQALLRALLPQTPRNYRQAMLLRLPQHLGAELKRYLEQPRPTFSRVRPVGLQRAARFRSAGDDGADWLPKVSALEGSEQAATLYSSPGSGEHR